MINKKLLAASIAATLSLSANAAVDLDATAPGAVKFLSEAIDSTAVSAAGLTVVSDAGVAGTLDLDVKSGFAIPFSTTRYVRFSLTNAVFEANLVTANLVVTEAAGVAPTETLLTGGQKGDNFVVYQVSTSTDGNVVVAGNISLQVDDLAISTTAPSTVTYTMHDSLSAAVGGSAAIYTKAAGYTSFAAGTTGQITVATPADKGSQALVVENFTTFTVDTQLATTGVVGRVDLVGAEFLVAAPGVQLNGNATTLVNAGLTNAQTITFAGDFSFGTWVTATDKNCTTGEAPLTLDTNKAVATTAATLDVTTTSYFLCVENDTNPALVARGSYSATLVADKLTATIGKITYDTTSVAINYVTTYSGYNQRIYLTNTGATAAKYSTTFRSEAGTTAVAKAAASGTLAAGTIISLKATDMVTLTGGKDRTSATIEIEAAKDSILATTQTVNIEDGSTDTVVLTPTQTQTLLEGKF